MKSIKLSIEKGADFEAAKRAASQAVAKTLAAPQLVSWIDRVDGLNGPLETCGGEREGCSASYARGLEVSHRVGVNDKDYEFFFVDTPNNTVQLDPEQVAAVHRGIDPLSFNNLQGG